MPLTGHPDPGGSGDNLQHIGFYGQGEDGPTGGADIPEFFQLKDTGTAALIMGFNPHATDWVYQVATAEIENFCHTCQDTERLKWGYLSQVFVNSLR